MRRGVALVLVTILIIAALMTPVPEAGAQTAPEDRLPPGIPVPPGQEVTRPPSPHDPARHGPPIANTQPGANLVGRPNVQLPERPRPPRTGPPEAGTPEGVPGTGDRGLWIRGGTGVHAQNDARTDLVIPRDAVGTTIYAPTHMAAGYTCLETVTAHWWYDGMVSTAHGHGFWDWCETDGSSGWQVFESMDATWLRKYVRRSGGEARYWTEVFRDEGTPGRSCWWGLLYNFEIGWWDGKAHICGTQPQVYRSLYRGNGWTMWESHHLMDQARVCPRFPDIAAADLLVHSGGNWVRLAEATSSQLGPYGLCWETSTYRFSVSPGLDVWQALTSGRSPAGRP
jgi:hypothetical protein